MNLILFFKMRKILRKIQKCKKKKKEKEKLRRYFFVLEIMAFEPVAARYFYYEEN